MVKDLEHKQLLITRIKTQGIKTILQKATKSPISYSRITTLSVEQNNTLFRDFSLVYARISDTQNPEISKFQLHMRIKTAIKNEAKIE